MAPTSPLQNPSLELLPSHLIIICFLLLPLLAMSGLIASSKNECSDEEECETDCSAALFHSRLNRPSYMSDSNSSVVSSSNDVHSETAIDLSQTYEYPKVVKDLKLAYQEMGITTALYVLNIVSAVGIVLVNKYIYSVYRFNYGVVLTFYHFALTSIGLRILARQNIFEPRPGKMLQVLPVSVSFCAYVVLTNLSFQYNSGTFYQVTKN